MHGWFFLLGVVDFLDFLLFLVVIFGVWVFFFVHFGGAEGVAYATLQKM
jgi:hypothetical protein